MIAYVNVLLQLGVANDALDPLVVVMALPAESNTDWFKTTTESLIRYERRRWVSHIVQKNCTICA